MVSILWKIICKIHCISQGLIREAELLGLYVSIDIWICYRDLTCNNSCGSSLDSLRKTTVFASDTETWSPQGRQLGKEIRSKMGKIIDRWEPMRKNWNRGSLIASHFCDVSVPQKLELSWAKHTPDPRVGEVEGGSWKRIRGRWSSCRHSCCPTAKRWPGRLMTRYVSGKSNFPNLSEAKAHG